MRRSLLPLCFAALAFTPNLAFADLAPTGGCNRCGVDDSQSDLGLAAVAFVGMVAGASLIRRRR